MKVLYTVPMYNLLNVISCKVLDSSSLGGTAAIMGNGSDVADHADIEACSLECPERRLSSGAGTLNENFNTPHAMFLSLLGRVFGGNLRRKRSALP